MLSRVGDSSGVLMSDTSKQVREVSRLMHGCKCEHCWCNADHSHSSVNLIGKMTVRVAGGRLYQGLGVDVVIISTICQKLQLLQLSCCKGRVYQCMFHHVGVEASHLHGNIS